MTGQQKRWAEFNYEPVGAIQNRLIARYLRTQRKNIRRLFQERGLFTLLDRMNQIRKSRQGMLAKNRYFQLVLNDYAKLTTNAVTPHVPGTVLQSPAATAEAPREASSS